MHPRPPTPTLFPYTTLFRSDDWNKTAQRYRSEPETGEGSEELAKRAKHAEHERDEATAKYHHYEIASAALDRKSTRLNSSHTVISYAVFCLKKKNRKTNRKV